MESADLSGLWAHKDTEVTNEVVSLTGPLSHGNDFDERKTLKLRVIKR